MSRGALLELVRERLGLDPATLGERVVDDACAEARRAFSVPDDAGLYRRVLLDAEAFAECAENFVVPESWFFRASEQFDDLVRFAREHPQRRPLRVLSLPCASGEEAHSAAIALLEAGLAPTDIDILGIDVSRAAVRRAEAGRYRHSAMRGRAPPAPWIHDTGDGLEVDALVRRCVRFRVGNALDPHLLRGEDRIDVVFCRNLLIYLHPGARAQLATTLLQALDPPGLVLAGQAEVLSSLSSEFQPYAGGSPLSFLRVPASAAREVATPKSPLQLRVRTPVAPSPIPVAAPRAAAAPETAPVAPDPIADARRLADAGQIDAARAASMAWLRTHPADVPAHFLLGLLEAADGMLEAAEQAFTRVLYLDPGHLDALEQRVGLAERRGHAAQARELRARAARLRKRLETRP